MDAFKQSERKVRYLVTFIKCPNCGERGGFMTYFAGPVKSYCYLCSWQSLRTPSKVKVAKVEPKPVRRERVSTRNESVGFFKRRRELKERR